MPDKRHELGAWGEELAVGFYQKQGYQFVGANWRAEGALKRKGEIDLIFRKGKELVFVEVKTRASRVFGSGEAAVDRWKKQKARRAIEQFLFEFPEFAEFSPRFDVLVVEIFSPAPRFVCYENVEL